MGARDEEHRNQLFHLDDIADFTLEQVVEQFSKREFTSKPPQKKVAAANDRTPRARQEGRHQSPWSKDAEVRVQNRVLHVLLQCKR